MSKFYAYWQTARHSLLKQLNVSVIWISSLYIVFITTDVLMFHFISYSNKHAKIKQSYLF